MQVDCTGCGYCMPCPADAEIPGCFDVYNKMHMFKNFEEAGFLYALRMSDSLLKSKAGYASQCVSCGTCVEKCPQHIPIPQMLAKVAEELEGPALQQRLEAVGPLFTAKPK
jgi:uncharacterized protein